MRTRPDTVMLFAAGFGTRMGSLTKTRPKPLIEVSGRALVDHALDQVRAYKPNRIVCNLHYLPEQVEAHLRNTGILFSLEAPNILDTGGGLKAATRLLNSDTVFTMNTDAVWRGPNALQHLANEWNPDRMDALLLCVSTSDATGYSGNGDFLISDEGCARRGPGAIYTGLQIIKTHLLNDIPATVFSLNVVWDQLIETSRLCATTYPGQWCDVGTPAGVKLAEDFLERDNA